MSPRIWSRDPGAVPREWWWEEGLRTPDARSGAKRAGFSRDMIPAVQERLQKILARAGFASRRGAEELMEQGRVTVNGDPVRELGTKADVATDDIRVDGVRVKAPSAPVYIVLNKPRGVVTTRRDPAGRQTVMELVPGVAGLFPVGRLDVTTEGLILLTNDGAFADRVAHPRYEVPRVYHAKVHRVPDARALERLHRGVTVEGDLLKADRVRVIGGGSNPWLELTLHEGKQHEVRRLLEAVGHPVSKLRRVAIGPVVAKGLEVGHFRALSTEEVAGLLRGEGAALTPARPPRRTRPAARGHAPARPRGRPGQGPGSAPGRPRAQERGGRGGGAEPEWWARGERRGGRARQEWSEGRGSQGPRKRGSGGTRRGSLDQQDQRDWTTAGGRRGQGSGRGAGRSGSTGGRGESRAGAGRGGRSSSTGGRGRGRQGASRGGRAGTGGHGRVGGGQGRGRRGGTRGRRR